MLAIRGIPAVASFNLVLQPYGITPRPGWAAVNFFFNTTVDCEGAIALPEALGLDLLPQIAIPKPPHRLQGLERNCAAPTRIDSISVLVWRHQLQGQPAFELHTAAKDVEAVRAKLV